MIYIDEAKTHLDEYLETALVAEKHPDNIYMERDRNNIYHETMMLAAVASAEALTRIADAMEKAAPADFTKELPF